MPPKFLSHATQKRLRYLTCDRALKNFRHFIASFIPSVFVDISFSSLTYDRRKLQVLKSKDVSTLIRGGKHPVFRYRTVILEEEKHLQIWRYSFLKRLCHLCVCCFVSCQWTTLIRDLFSCGTDRGGSLGEENGLETGVL